MISIRHKRQSYLFGTFVQPYAKLKQILERPFGEANKTRNFFIGCDFYGAP